MIDPRSLSLDLHRKEPAMTTYEAPQPLRLTINVNGANSAAECQSYPDHQPPFATVKIGKDFHGGISFFFDSPEQAREILLAWADACTRPVVHRAKCRTCDGTTAALLCLDCSTRRPSGATCPGCGGDRVKVIACPNCEPEGAK
jgi:hypothetical protein